METLNIGQAISSDYTNSVDDVEVAPLSIDSATGQNETIWENSKATQQWGYFNANPDLKSAILMKATWNVGLGYTCDSETEVILDHISGWGKDTFQDILYNLEVNKRIFGDAYAEIIKDGDILINLKVLNPQKIRHIVGKDGRLIRYEQIANDGKIIKFAPDKILHFSNNRLADQIHGISDIDVMGDLLAADNESFKDMKQIMHHQAKPFILWKLKTDDPDKIQAIVAKIDAARNLGEDMFIPDDSDAVSYEVVQLNPSALNLSWRDEIRKKFYRNIGLPELFPSGGGDATESGGKIGYAAFETPVKSDQRRIELTIWNQLALRIKLIQPASIMNNLNRDNAKDPNSFMPNDMMAGVGQ